MDAEISSAMEEASADALGFLGEDVKVGTKNYRARVSSMTHDNTMLAGGEGEAGGFRVWILKRDMPRKPDEGGQITARGVTLDILSVEERDDKWLITTGDITTE